MGRTLWKTKRRVPVGIAFDPTQLVAIERLARKAMLNRSDMIRMLLAEALEQRQRLTDTAAVA